MFITGTMFTSCQSSSKKVENAQDKIEEAKDKVVKAEQELSQAIKDSIQQFKKVSEEKINAMNKTLRNSRLE